ncbi:MAG: Tfp pilus assembly protein FimT/FimU [Dissulfuribacterales bacterium]
MKNRSGFTLMELMIAIAIFAILVAIATPNAISWLRNSQFNSAVRNVKATIEGMRMYAVKANSDAVIRFDGDNTFETEKHNRGTVNPPVTHHLASGISVTSLTFTNDELRYNSRGMAKNGTLEIRSDNGLCRRIVVAVVGSSRIEECH